jgi:riboflavin biosynthesis pyrimidine reductase
VLIVTTAAGAERLATSRFPANVGVAAASTGPEVSPAQALQAIAAAAGPGTVLLEGGPSVMGAFFGANLVDELFLTVAPQLAGRASGSDRPGLVAGRLLAPNDPRWGTLVSLKRAGDMLFLRYRFPRGEGPSE